MQPRHVRLAVRLLKTSVIRQGNEIKIHERCVLICICEMSHNAYFLFLCSVESSEIDLSEFQVGNGEDGDHHGGDGGNDDPAQPSTVAAESAPGNGGWSPISLLLSPFASFSEFL